MTAVNNNDYCSSVNTYRGCNGVACGKKHASIKDAPEIVDAYFNAATFIHVGKDARTQAAEYLHVIDMETVSKKPALDEEFPKTEKTMFLFIGHYDMNMPEWALLFHNSDVAGAITLRHGHKWKMEWYAYKRYALFVWIRKVFKNLKGIVYYSNDYITVKDLEQGIELERAWRIASNTDLDSPIFKTKAVFLKTPGNFVLDRALFYFDHPLPRPYPPKPVLSVVPTVPEIRVVQQVLPTPQNLPVLPAVTVESTRPTPEIRIVQTPPVQVNVTAQTAKPQPRKKRVVKKVASTGLVPVVQIVPPIVPKTAMIIPRKRIVPKVTIAPVIPPVVRVIPPPPPARHENERKRPREREVDNRMSDWHGSLSSSARESRKPPTDFSEFDLGDSRNRRYDDRDFRGYEDREDRGYARRERGGRTDRYRDGRERDYRDHKRRESPFRYRCPDMHRYTEPVEYVPRRPETPRTPPHNRGFEESDDEDFNAEISQVKEDAPRSGNTSKLHLYSAQQKTEVQRQRTPDWLSSGDINTNENYGNGGSGNVMENDEDDRMKTNFEVPVTADDIYAALDPEELVIQFCEDQCFSVRVLRDSDILISPKGILEYLFTGHSDLLMSELRSEYRKSAIEMYEADKIPGKTAVILGDEDLAKLRNRVVASFMLFALTVMRGIGSYSAPMTMRNHVTSFGKCESKRYLKRIRDDSYPRDLRVCANLLRWMNDHPRTIYRRAIGYCKYLGESLRLFGVSHDVTHLIRTKQLQVNPSGEFVVRGSVRKKNKNVEMLVRLLEKYKDKITFKSMNLRVLLHIRFAAETQFSKHGLLDLHSAVSKLWGGVGCDEMVILKKPEARDKFPRELKRELVRNGMC